MKEKLKSLLKELNHGLVDREETIKAALLAALAGEHVVLIGPPGTGKSLVARRVSEAFSSDKDEDKSYFEYLLTKFSTPEELFGPLSIAALKEDRFERKMDKYLPTVKFAFLDEIFKASSSILNSLLTILNERIYHNGARPEKVPLRALIAASNELPTGQDELNALYDRFLVRRFVNYVDENGLHELFNHHGDAIISSKLTEAELDQIEKAAEAVSIPEDVRLAIVKIWQQHKQAFKEDRRESLSDRRLKKVLGLLRISAATNGRNELDLSDVLLLKDCLWNHQENRDMVHDIILKALKGFSRPVPLGAGIAPALAKTPPEGKKVGAKIKGMKGSGTESDPLLIENHHDLMRLDSPEVGLQGYCFRQTEDIDCTEFSSWTSFEFKGEYDGSGHAIEYKGDDNYLFKTVKPQSKIRSLRLVGVCLAEEVDGAMISDCQTNLDIVGDVIDSELIACRAGRSLVKKDARKCSIATCQSGSVMIGNNAISCKISDCLVVVDRHDASNTGCIARGVSDKSVIERCYSSGTFTGFPVFHLNIKIAQGDVSGVAIWVQDSVIRQCGIGVLAMDKGSQGLNFLRLVRGFAGVTFNNNASIDLNEIGSSASEGVDSSEGRSVSAVLFKQPFFENNLGWDFDNVWQWDDANDRPALRALNGGVSRLEQKADAPGHQVIDLLALQVAANIWLGRG